VKESALPAGIGRNPFPFLHLKMSQDAVVRHISSRIKADVEFLVEEGLMSRYDADQVIGKLPSAPEPSGASVSAPTIQSSLRSLVTPPSSTASTPAVERFLPGFKRNPPPPPPAVVQSSPAYQQYQQARAQWGYNEDGSVSIFHRAAA
jgi:hypothetical protein